MRMSTEDQITADIDDLLGYLELPRSGDAARRLRVGIWRAVEAGELRPIQVQRLAYAVLSVKTEDNAAEWAVK